MRRNTPRRARRDRQVARPRREFWQVLFPWCWFCERQRSECTHEMASGSGNRHAAVADRIAWASACWNCNCDRLTDNGGAGQWPLAKQLAVKWIYDRAYYDRVAFNRLRGRADDAISQAEVVLWVCRILDAGRKGR